MKNARYEGTSETTHAVHLTEGERNYLRDLVSITGAKDEWLFGVPCTEEMDMRSKLLRLLR